MVRVGEGDADELGRRSRLLLSALLPSALPASSKSSHIRPLDKALNKIKAISPCSSVFLGIF